MQETTGYFQMNLIFQDLVHISFRSKKGVQKDLNRDIYLSKMLIFHSVHLFGSLKKLDQAL